jgi:hypothetical protein
LSDWWNNFSSFLTNSSSRPHDKSKDYKDKFK